jgi:hypothetical protein
MKKIIITSVLTAILTTVVVSIAQDGKHIDVSPSPNGAADRYEVIAAKVSLSIVGDNGGSNQEESCVIRLDKITGKAWFYARTFDARDGQNKFYQVWTPIDN